MANRRQLVKRRKSVRNIRKITRTMQLIATARFQKALGRAMATKPYAAALSRMVAAASKAQSGKVQPLLQQNTTGQVALLVITSNRGLCGGYNANVLRTLGAELRQRRAAGEEVELHAIGKKGINYLRFLGEEMASRSTAFDDQPRFEQVARIADEMMARYVAGELSAVHVCSMRFISAGQQRPACSPLLPLTFETPAEAEAGAADEVRYDYIPEPDQLIDELLPASVRMRLFQYFNDAVVSEQVARMVAMKAATDSAAEMIKLLTRQYNRARQTSITMELLDIIGGVAAIQK